MSFRQQLLDLHETLYTHLTELHHLFHRQQLQYVRTRVELLLPTVSECEVHTQQLQQVIGDIESLLQNNHLNQILQMLSNFLADLDLTDGCSALETLQEDLLLYLRLLGEQPTKSLTFSDLRQIDSSLAYAEIIDPISNQKRLEILLAIHQGNKRFKELEEELNLQAGHLIYHLNPLKKSNIVTQDPKKNYLLTDKGLAMLDAISKIYENFQQ